MNVRNIIIKNVYINKHGLKYYKGTWKDRRCLLLCSVVEFGYVGI